MFLQPGLRLNFLLGLRQPSHLLSFYHCHSFELLFRLRLCLRNLGQLGRSSWSLSFVPRLLERVKLLCSHALILESLRFKLKALFRLLICSMMVLLSGSKLAKLALQAGLAESRLGSKCVGQVIRLHELFHCHFHNSIGLSWGSKRVRQRREGLLRRCW